MNNKIETYQVSTLKITANHDKKHKNKAVSTDIYKRHLWSVKIKVKTPDTNRFM